jgi:hypothetical protein
MNDEMKKALSDFLGLLLEGIKTGTSFAQQQIPLVIQEKLNYEIYSSFAWMGIWLFIILLAWIVQQTVWRITNPKRTGKSRLAEGEEAARAITTIGAVLGSIGGLIDIIYNIDHVVYVWVAPRVYLLEWLKELIK